MTNWEHFKNDAKYYLAYFHKPTLHIITDDNDYYLRNYMSSEAVALYRKVGNVIVIRNQYNNLFVRLHEYGHWINHLIFCTLELIWEFVWWGLSIRNLFIKRVK